MTKYYVTVIFDASKQIEVEADSPEDAAQKAYESDECYVSLCHRCSHEIDMGDAVRAFVYDESCTEELYDDGADV